MKPAYLISLFVMAVCLAVTMFAFSGAIARHVNIEQAMAKPNETVQVPGNIVKETVRYDALHGRLVFDITDKKDPSKRMTVVYAEPKPENFDTATQVEAVGAYKDGVFRAQNLLIKCPSKYSDEPPVKAAAK